MDERIGWKENELAASWIALGGNTKFFFISFQIHITAFSLQYVH